MIVIFFIKTLPAFQWVFLGRQRNDICGLALASSSSKQYPTLFTFYLLLALLQSSQPIVSNFLIVRHSFPLFHLKMPNHHVNHLEEAGFEASTTSLVGGTDHNLIQFTVDALKVRNTRLSFIERNEIIVQTMH